MESTMKKLKQKLSFMSSWRKKEERKMNGKSKKAEENEKMFMENGSRFLKELIADCNGKSIPIRNFSAFQIHKATNNFHSSCLVTHKWGDDWYKGIIKDRLYLIKRFSRDRSRVGEAYNDFVLSTRMSNHSNFLKLLGCCFEFSCPVVVFEYAEHAVLNEEGRIMINGEEHVLPWSVRLKIAKELANAVTYLHTAFPKIIIHRDIKPTNIFLDKNWTVKLYDFSISVILPEGKSRIEVEYVAGTTAYSDPLYLDTGFVTEYTDVYSFGVCLLVFLTGRSAFAFYMEPNPNGTGFDQDPLGIVPYVKGLYENGKLDKVVDPMLAKDITSGQRMQVEACVVLALRCCEERDEDRLKMIDVAKELKRIQQTERANDEALYFSFSFSFQSSV